MPKIIEDLHRVFRENPTGVFTLDLLATETHVDAIEQLVPAIDWLVRRGAVKRIVRVQSPRTHIGIGPDYQSVVEVPRRMLDTTTGDEFEVGIDDIKQLFRST